MTIKNKEQLLRDFALSCFNNPEHKEGLQSLLENLSLTQEEVVQAYVDYDLDIFAYGNEIYDTPAIRIMMYVHNLLEGSWHVQRQESIYKFITQANPSSIIDVGFGIPSLYVRKFINDENLKITLVDFSDSAVTFASKILDVWSASGNWPTHVDFIVEDMMITSSKPPKNDIYLFQDSIEHVVNPTECLANFVRNSSPEAKFLLSLPIGPIVPMHNIAWASTEEATKWLNDIGLEVDLQEKVSVNPEVDLFAEQLNFDCTNMIVLCHKTIHHEF